MFRTLSKNALTDSRFFARGNTNAALMQGKKKFVARSELGGAHVFEKAAAASQALGNIWKLPAS